MGMPLKITCPFCGRKFWTQLDMRGRWIGGRCFWCKRIVRGPGAMAPKTPKEPEK